MTDRLVFVRDIDLEFPNNRFFLQLGIDLLRTRKHRSTSSNHRQGVLTEIDWYAQT